MYRQSIQGSSAPGGRVYSGEMSIRAASDASLRLSCHFWILVVLGSAPIGSIVARKLLLDFSLLFGGCWSNRGWLSSVSCRRRSLALATPLLMSGGAMPDRRYKQLDATSNAAVGVIQGWVELLCISWTLSYWTGILRTGVPHRARAVVRSVGGWAPHLELPSLVRMLIQALTLAFTFSTCIFIGEWASDLGLPKIYWVWAMNELCTIPGDCKLAFSFSGY